MTIEYKITNTMNIGQTWTCHEDLIEPNFGTVDGFVAHYANKWEVPTSLIVIEEIDLAPVTIEAIVDTMFYTADNTLLEMWPRNERERMAGWLIEGKAVAEIQATVAWADAVWDDYMVTASKIRAGDLTATMQPIPPRPYTWAQTKAAATS